MRTNFEVKDLVESMKECVKVPDKDMELNYTEGWSYRKIQRSIFSKTVYQSM